MTRKKIIQLHIFLWLFALLANLPYPGIIKGMTTPVIVSNIIGFLYLVIVFYLFYLYLAPILLKRKNISLFFSVSFAVVLIMPFFGYFFLFLSRAYFDHTFSHFFRGYSIAMHMSGYFPVLIAALFGSFFRVIISWFDTVNRQSETEKQKLSIELELLKSKLNPHFLFNTLNNIDSLIRKDPEEASSSLIRLSEVMRYLTYETTSDSVELERERDYIINYIDLHRMRIKTPQDIRLNAEGDMTARISPALFIPLIENAFKFASFRGEKPAVDINLVSKGGIINFSISNCCEEALTGSGKGSSGFGLSNLKKRLELTYPGRHELRTEMVNRQFRAELIIDTNAD